MSHQIETVEDFVRILKEHPEWRERVREVLLNEEGLSLSDAAEVLQMCGYKAYPALIGVGIEPYAHKLVQREGVLTFLDGSILHYGVFSGL